MRLINRSILLALLMTLLGLVPGISCQKSSPRADPAPDIVDGIYLVSRYSENRNELLPLAKGEKLIVQDRTFGGAGPEESPVYLVLDESANVPLFLAAKPDKGKDQDGKEFVSLKLSPDISKDFEQLTGNNVGNTLAVVIGDKAVSKHKVRLAITGGNLRVSCCGVGTCDYLFSQLRDNVKL